MKNLKYKLLTFPIIKSFWNLKLKQKLVISYILFIIVPLLTFSLLIFNKISGIIMENTKYSAVKSFDSTYSYLSNKIYQIGRIADVIHNDKPLHNILEKVRSEYSMADQISDMQALTIYLKSLQENEVISKIRLYVSPGLLYSEENTNLFNMEEAKKTDWFKRIENNYFKLAYLPSHFFQNENNGYEILSVARFIIDSNNYREKLGLVRLDFKKSDILYVINNSNTIEGSLTYLENSLGEVIATSDDTLIQLYHFDSTSGSPSYESVNFTDAYINNDKVMLRVKAIPQTDWNMVTIIPYREITRKISQTRNQVLFIMLLISLVAYALAFSIAHFMVKRLSILKVQMNKVHMGSMEAMVNEGSNDEIGELINDYNYMIEKINLLMKEQYQSGQRLKAAELKALQAQINPHFLYNTLEMINRLSKKNKATEIESVLHSMTKFYKLSLNKGEDLITLKDELEHVSAYVSIQNMRFMNNINFEIDVKEEFLSTPVPKIILQPIVENSILHGIMEKEERTGTVRIFSKAEDNFLVLYIQDDGVGIPEDTLLRINSGMISSNKGSYGVKNVSERIKLLYGKEYGLEYLSEYGHGTTVRILLPKVSIKSE